MERHVLFYSNYCDYSRDVLGTVVQKGLRHLFVLVCVDKRSALQLPDFVDRVPLIFTIDRRVLSDDAVGAFIDNLATYCSGIYSSSSNSIEQPGSAAQQHHGNDSNNANGSGGAAADGEIAAWSAASASISDTFSLLTGASDASLHNFVDVSGPMQSIVTPPDDGVHANAAAADSRAASNTRAGSKSLSLENFKAQRDSDMHNYFPPRAPLPV